MVLGGGRQLGGGILHFHVKNLGCKVNRVESDTIAAALIDMGVLPSSAESRGRQTARRARPRAKH